MNIKDDFSAVFQQHKGENNKLYSYLATNYNISDLASKIYASKSAQMNVLSLRKSGGVSV